jgi:hypothetical protein
MLDGIRRQASEAKTESVFPSTLRYLYDFQNGAAGMPNLLEASRRGAARRARDL